MLFKVNVFLNFRMGMLWRTPQHFLKITDLRSAILHGFTDLLLFPVNGFQTSKGFLFLFQYSVNFSLDLFIFLMKLLVVQFIQFQNFITTQFNTTREIFIP